MKSMKIVYVILALILTVFMLSCQKEVFIELPEPENKLVVEGWIEQDQYPVVSLTRNSPYFSAVDSSTLANLFILNAQVYVSDGTLTEQLTIDFSNAFLGIWPFVCYKGSLIKGEVGKSYYLTIYAEGDTITGVTTIPEPVVLDTVWWKPEPNTDDTLGYIWGIYNDDPLLKQYFRLFTLRKGRDLDWVPAFGSVYDDIFFNGIEFEFSIYRGVTALTDIEAIENDDELFAFKKGDTILLKIGSIDREHYDFWRTVEQEYFSGGNPFVFPVVIRHNVEGAIGVWGGYGASIYQVIAE